MNKKYNWESAEQFFMDSGYRSGITLKDISERFMIPYQTVRRYAAAHEWHSRRYRVWLQQEYRIGG